MNTSEDEPDEAGPDDEAPTAEADVEEPAEEEPEATDSPTADDTAGGEDEPGEATPETPGADGPGAVVAVRTWLTTAPLWQVGVAAVLVAGVATEIVGSLGGRALDVPMEAPAMGSDDPETIFIGGFVMANLFYGIPGVLVAMLLAWKVSKPAQLWVVLALVVTVLSFAAPITAQNTETATKVVLAVTHVITAAIVIPVVALRLNELERQGSAEAVPASEPA